MNWLAILYGMIAWGTFVGLAGNYLEGKSTQEASGWVILFCVLLGLLWPMAWATMISKKLD